MILLHVIYCTLTLELCYDGRLFASIVTSLCIALFFEKLDHHRSILETCLLDAVLQC